MTHRLGLIAVAVGAIGFGITAEALAFSFAEPQLWVPDLVVGLAFVGAGLWRWHQRGALTGAAVLFLATGICWWLGNFSTQLLYLHRGPLVHLMLAYPGWRARSRLDGVVIAAAYIMAAIPALWPNEAVTIVFAVGLVLVGVHGFRTAVGFERHERRRALAACAAFAVVLIMGAALRLAYPPASVVEPLLIAYMIVLVVIAVGLGFVPASPPSTTVADLVVELGESRSGTLRDRLARELKDPGLQVGYWSAEAESFVDASGRAVTLPASGGRRTALRVDRNGSAFATVVVDATVLRDPGLTGAIAAATRLSTSNVALQEEVQAQAASVVASRRRLLVAADEERRQLEARVSDGPQQRLEDLAETLTGLGAAGAEVDRAREQLAQGLRELRELAQGLHPRELVKGGLPVALAGLAERATVPTEVDVRVPRMTAELELTLYLVCSEALANVAKYAQASRAWVEAAESAGRVHLAVTDDGRGGADPASGTGLRGLADRVEALGGRLSVQSPAGAGTRVAAEVPLGGDTA